MFLNDDYFPEYSQGDLFHVMPLLTLSINRSTSKNGVLCYVGRVPGIPKHLRSPGFRPSFGWDWKGRWEGRGLLSISMASASDIADDGRREG